MKNEIQIDCVKMMREIRNKISSDMKDMNSEQILEYIKKGKEEFENSISIDYENEKISSINAPFRV